MFSSPIFLIGSVLATLWAGICYALFGKKLPDLFLYWIASLAGFFIGHYVADLLGLSFFQLGDVHAIEGTIGSWLAMFIVRWLGL